MREFKTLEEFKQYRRACPTCMGQLYYKGCSNIGESYLMKVAYKAEDYIFNIGIKTPRIGYSIIDLSNSMSFGTTFASNKSYVNSINPLKITCSCSKSTDERTFRTGSEYSCEIGIIHDGKTQGAIQKIVLLSEKLSYRINKRYYNVALFHKDKKINIDELNDSFRVNKTFHLNYDTVNQDKIYNKNYILNKIQTITLLQ